MSETQLNEGGAISETEQIILNCLVDIICAGGTTEKIHKDAYKKATGNELIRKEEALLQFNLKEQLYSFATNFDEVYVPLRNKLKSHSMKIKENTFDRVY